MILTRSKFSGFTLVELIVVICIIGMLSIFSYVPYSYYGNIAKTKASAAKIEQVLGESHWLAASGYPVNSADPGNTELADILVVLRKWADSIRELSSASGATFMSLTDLNDVNKFHAIRTVKLEDKVSIVSVGVPADAVVLRFRAPNGKMEILGSDGSGMTVGFTGGIVGWGGTATGTLSHNFIYSGY